MAGQSTVWARLPPAPSPAPATAAGPRKHRESADHRDPLRSCGIPGPSHAGRCRGGRLTARANMPAPDFGPCMIPQGLRPWTPPGTQSLDPLPAFGASLRRLESSQELPAHHTSRGHEADTGRSTADVAPVAAMTARGNHPGDIIRSAPVRAGRAGVRSIPAIGRHRAGASSTGCCAGCICRTGSAATPSRATATSNGSAIR